MIYFYTNGSNYFYFYNSDSGWTNNRTNYTSFVDVYELSLLITNTYIADVGYLLYNLKHPDAALSLDQAIPNRQLLLKCSYSDLPNLPQLYPELFI